MRAVETVTLHFNLSHLSHLPEHQPFTLKAFGTHVALERHTAATLAHHATENAALRVLGEAHLPTLTHFAERVTVPADAVSLHWVGYPSTRPDAVSDEIAVVFQHAPRAAVRRAVQDMQHDGVLRTPAGLAHRGLAGLADHPDLALLHEHASLLIDYTKSAMTMVMQHPEIGTLAPDLHYRIEELIGGDLPLPSFTQLWQYLSTHPAEGPNPWYDNTFVAGPDGKPMATLDDLVDSEGHAVAWPTKRIDGRDVHVMPQFVLSAGLDSVLTAVIQDAGRAVKQQPWLKGRQWSTQHGVTEVSRTNVAPTQPLRAGGAQPDWTIVNKTSKYGLDLYGDSIKFDAKTSTLTFDVKNWPNRGLGVYVQFLGADDTPITHPNGVAPLGPAAHLQSDPTKKYLTHIGAGSTFFGVPVWAPRTPITFVVPSHATGANVLVGGLGNGNWDMDVDLVGVIYTCFVSYGIPSLLAAMSVGVQSSKWYIDFFADPENVALLVAAAGPLIVGIGCATIGVEATLIKVARFVAGVLFSRALKALAQQITGYVTAQQIVQNAPFVGWALRVASQACAIADMIATSIEVGLSPATYQLQAKCSMTLNVSVGPDPTTGTRTQKPVWPAVGDHYVIQVQYKGGTTLRKTGPMPRRTDDPITVAYSRATNDALPSAPGQQFQIIASIYSATEVLCGKWVSGWIEAVPTDGDARTEKGSIIEQLVPLVPGTTYTHRTKLHYDGPTGTYTWSEQPAPTETAANLSRQSVRQLVDITVNNLAHKAGYCYLAGDQNLPLDHGDKKQSSPMYVFESVSTLADPGAGMLAPTRGFSVQPYIAYDQFGPAGLFTIEPADKYVADLDKGAALPADIATAFADNGFPQGGAMRVTVVTPGASWELATAGRPAAFALRRQVDVIKVFHAPVPEFSPNNFYLDTRSYGSTKLSQLRLVDLTDRGTSFDYDSTQSWGALPMNNLSALAVHPNGFVIAISYRDNKMAIVELPSAGVPDADAPQALPFCGAGLREGLLQGPVGMTISADGRILVLERINARIQAFDTQANPVQCFAGTLEFGIPATLAGELDNAVASTALLQALQRNVPVLNTSAGAYDPRYLLTPVFSMDAGFVATLDARTVTADLREQFDANALPLGDGAQILATAQGIWLLRDLGNGVDYDVRYKGEGRNRVDVYRCFTPTIDVKSPKTQWLVQDKTNTLSFDVTLAQGKGTLRCRNLTSLMALEDGPSAAVTYLDVAVETKGFIYVLSHVNDGAKTSDYRLDIYQPDGTPLTPDKGSHNGQVNAARMTVNQWRTLFTLNYEQMAGRDGRPEPTISQWIPSTPRTQNQ